MQSIESTIRVRRTLIVGLGSMHGDDVAGWLAAEELEKEAPAVHVRTAQSPLDILHWLPNYDVCVICDACRGAGEAGTVHCWTWPATEFSSVRWSGTHDISLPQALRLAEQLRKLASRVVVCSIEADPQHQPLNTHRSCQLSEPVGEAFPQFMACIRAEADLSN